MTRSEKSIVPRPAEQKVEQCGEVCIGELPCTNSENAEGAHGAETELTEITPKPPERDSSPIERETPASQPCEYSSRDLARDKYCASVL